MVTSPTFTRPTTARETGPKPKWSKSMITISINGRMLDAIYALVTSMTSGAAPETAPDTVEAPETAPVEKPETAPDTVEAPETAPVEKPEAGRRRKKAAPREHVAVTRPEAPIATSVETSPEPIKAAETVPEPIKSVETPPEPIKPAETPPEPTKAPAPVALDDEWPATLTKPSAWDYDGQGASWRAANQIGTAELGAAIQRVYIDHADIIKMPSVRVAMTKLGLAGWWGCVAKNIADARDASNRPLDITPKVEAKND